MKQRVLSVALALCLCSSYPSVAYASQEDPLQQEGVLPEAPAEGKDPSGNVPAAPAKLASINYPSTLRTTRDGTIPTPKEAYEAMIALKEQEGYKEGTPWTDYEPYSDSNYYHWNGGAIGGANISAVGCVAFAFTLSDAAFGSLPNRMYAAGDFSYEDIKVGDILRVNNDTHTVIVLEVSDVGVTLAEGNIGIGDHKGKVHWGRTMSRDEVMANASHYITRYPEGYVAPDDPEANVSIGSGTLEGGLAWNLTKAGTLTISGQGAMPDYSSQGEQPWNSNSDKIRKVIIGDGVTNIGSCAFWGCGVIGAEISSSVTAIGNSAFRDSRIIAVNIPSSVKTIGDSAFRECQNLSSVTVSEGVETINQNAFRSCASLTSIVLPSSIGEVGSAAFFQCNKMVNAKFAPGSKQVKMGDNIFTQCYSLMGVTLPVNIDRIGEGMFQNCGMLVGVEIPQGTEIIEGSAFASCSAMTTVIIPDSVTSIGIAAFANCPLKDIYFTGSEAQWNSIGKLGDTIAAVSKATLHYNYVPSPSPDPGDGDDNNTGDNDNTPGGGNDNNTGDGNDTPGGDDNTPGGGNDNNTGGGNDNTGNGDGNTPGNGDNNTGGGNGNTPGDGDNNTGGGNGNASGDGDNTPGGGNNNTPGGGDNNNTGDGNGTPGGGNDNNTGGDNNNAGNNPGSGSGDNAGNNTGSGSDKDKGNSKTSSGAGSDTKAVVETWKPTTPDEIKRYACVGKEAVQYTPSKDNAYPVTVENAMQGPMCFKSFEAALAGYTIGRTYNIYSLSGNAYSMDKEVQITIKIPSAIYKENREYKMICVTKDGQPIVYSDTDRDPRTITIETNKFYAYALIYK